MTPKLIEHIHLDIPKDLTPKVDEMGNMSVSAVHQIAVKQVESINDAICKEIRNMAVADGIDDVYVLDKKNILAALQKQIPKKPIVHGFREGREVNTISFTCPVCHKHIGRENYCNHCGQALKRSDSE